VSKPLDTLVIKRLHQNDFVIMRQVNALFAQSFDAVDDYRADTPDDATLAERVAEPNIIALTALKNGYVIGGLTAYILPKLEQARSEVYIYDLAVSETYRRQGVATALIDDVRRIGRNTGAWMLFVQADYGDDPAIALYTKLGAREDVMHFDIQPKEN
jgi:aminoglycoside 3-N-acetyltransferase I